MAEVGQYSFENLNHSGILKGTSKDSKDVSFSLNVFGGNTNFAVFTAAGGKPWSLSLSPKALAMFTTILRKMQREPTTMREPIMLNEFVEENGRKGMKQMGQFAFGIDESKTVFIEVAHNNLSGRHIFLIKGDSKYDYSQTSLSEKDIIQGTLEYLIQGFSTASTVAQRMSSFKRAPGGGNRGGGSFGGNRSGGGGNWNNNSNNGGGNKPSGGTFGGGPDTENDMYV